MKILFLGTNGWYDTETGNTICVLIETDKYFVILDAGNGIYKIDQYIKKKKPIYLFLSHFHLDHIVGLHILNKFEFSQGIKVYVPPGLKRYLTTILNNPYSLSIKQLKTKIELYELGRDLSQCDIRFAFKKLLHFSLCYGYRFYLEDKIVSYCTDTGVCDNLYFLAEKSDVFITECSLLPKQQSDLCPHLNPEKAAQVARDSGVKKLVLVHFDASLYSNFADREQAGKMAKKIFKSTIVAHDDLRIEL